MKLKLKLFLIGVGISIDLGVCGNCIGVLWDCNTRQLDHKPQGLMGWVPVLRLGLDLRGPHVTVQYLLP